jgi:DinB family protein
MSTISALSTMTASAHRQLMTLVDEAFDGRSWHGPTLRQSLRGITARQAAWRPGPRRHNIQEVVAHAAYWKHEVRRRIASGRDPFPLKGRNWFENDGRKWADDVRLLVEEHRALRKAIASLPAKALGRRVHGRDTTAFTIRGIAAHDLYHAGQIQLLKRLQKRRSR